MNKGTAEGEKQMTVAEAIREYVNETEGWSSMSKSRKRVWGSWIVTD